jgi:hypothetical protein
VLGALLLTAGFASAETGDAEANWPVADATCKPWAYNWWLGSAVDKENITKEFERYSAAGLGGIHIIPIYGVKGAEAREIPYLSPQWMEMLEFAVQEGKRLGLGVDMSTGTGWCFGGPNVTPDTGGQGITISDRCGGYPSLKLVGEAGCAGRRGVDDQSILRRSHAPVSPTFHVGVCRAARRCPAAGHVSRLF